MTGGGTLSDEPDDWFEERVDSDSLGDEEEDFAAAFKIVGGGDGGSVGGTEFDDDLDSDIPRIDPGIEGLDKMVRGGVPERSLFVAVGVAGTGKTTLGLQFIDVGWWRVRKACSSP